MTNRTNHLAQEFLSQLERKAADPEVRQAGIKALNKLATSALAVMILADDLAHFDSVGAAHAAAEHKLQTTENKPARWRSPARAAL
jgi:hypothetical protein